MICNFFQCGWKIHGSWMILLLCLKFFQGDSFCIKSKLVFSHIFEAIQGASTLYEVLSIPSETFTKTRALWHLFFTTKKWRTDFLYKTVLGVPLALSCLTTKFEYILGAIPALAFYIFVSLNVLNFAWITNFTNFAKIASEIKCANFLTIIKLCYRPVIQLCDRSANFLI